MQLDVFSGKATISFERMRMPSNTESGPRFGRRTSVISYQTSLVNGIGHRRSSPVALAPSLPAGLWDGQRNRAGNPAPPSLRSMIQGRSPARRHGNMWPRAFNSPVISLRSSQAFWPASELSARLRLLLLRLQDVSGCN